MSCSSLIKERGNTPFPSRFEPHYESKPKCKVFIMKISFHSYANKTNFPMESFTLNLTFIMKFTATRKWPIKKKKKMFGRRWGALEILSGINRVWHGGHFGFNSISTGTTVL